MKCWCQQSSISCPFVSFRQKQTIAQPRLSHPIGSWLRFWMFEKSKTENMKLNTLPQKSQWMKKILLHNRISCIISIWTARVIANKPQHRQCLYRNEDSYNPLLFMLWVFPLSIGTLATLTSMLSVKFSHRQNTVSKSKIIHRIYNPDYHTIRVEFHC